jgi:hypothetical protein
MPGRSDFVRPTPPLLPADYADILRYYTLSLEAANRSPRTIQTYLESLTLPSPTAHRPAASCRAEGPHPTRNDPRATGA